MPNVTLERPPASEYAPYHLDTDSLARRGSASGFVVSVRAMAYVIAGHVAHHERILKERYLMRSEDREMRKLTGIAAHPKL